MSILDYICIALIGGSVVICALKGLKKIIFKIAAFVISVILAKLVGGKIGHLLLSDIININFGSLSSEINGRIISILGTLIVFILLFIFLKLIFKVVEGKMGQNIQSLIVDRLLGALVGFFIGVAIVLVFTEVVDIVLSVISLFKRDADVFDVVDNTIIFRLVRNLN